VQPSNKYLLIQGNVVNRPGTQFVIETKYSDKESRLIPFQFNVSQTYILEFGDLYMRIITDGAQVVYPVGHASAGDPVEIITPYLEADLNRIQFAQSADVLFMSHPGYPPQEVKRFSATEWTVSAISFGSSASTPTWLASDAVGTAQYYKVTSIVGGEESTPSTATGSSSETSTISWTAVFGATAYNVYKMANGIYSWIGESGGSSFEDTTLVGDATKRPPDANNPFSDEPVLESLGDNLIPIMTADSLLTCSGGGWSASTTNVWPTSSSLFQLVNAFDGDIPTNVGYLTNNTGAAVVTIVPDADVAVGGYSVSSGSNGVGNCMTDWKFEGYNGSIWVTLDEQIGVTSWVDNETRIFSFVNEVEYEQYRITILGNSIGSGGGYSTIGEFQMFTGTYSEAANYPGSVNIYEQRLVFARTDSSPQTIFGSQTGNYYNYNISSPLQDDDAYEFTVASNQVNEIQWISAVKSMLLGTSGAEWEMSSGANSNAITPTNVNISPQGNRGSDPIVPIIIGSSLLYVGRGGKNIRDFGYSFDIDGYNGDELTVLASHLFEDREVIAWAFQRLPYSIVWLVGSDGKLLGLTYDKKQNVIAWHKHDTDGLFESVATIPGDG